MFWFAFGFLLGVLAMVGLAGLFAWRLICAGNRQAAAKLLEGFAMVLFSKPKAPPITTESPLAKSMKARSTGNAPPQTQAAGAAVGAKPSEVNTARNRLLLEVNKANNGNKQQLPGDSRKQEKTNQAKTEDHHHDK